MKTPDLTKAKSSAPSKRKFTGTDNPRHLRIIHMLLRRPLSRAAVDSIAGCANGPQLISDLRDLGLGKVHLRCEFIDFIDRDGYKCRHGIYYLTEMGRRMVYGWMVRRKKGSLQKEFSNAELEGFDGPL